MVIAIVGALKSELIKLKDLFNISLRNESNIYPLHTIKINE
jgi:hypothetical protein